MGPRRSAQYQELTVDLPGACARGKIGIVTVTYNSAPVLGEFLSSLKGQTYGNFLLVAVDNASKDATLPILDEQRPAGTVVIANATNLGVAAGNNLGIRSAISAGCEYVLLLNNDVVLGPRLLELLVDGMTRFACEMTVPMMYFHTPPDRIWAAGGGFHSTFGLRIFHRFVQGVRSAETCRAARIDYTPTCCVLLRREVFAKIGLMDERYFVYSDDVDFMFRAKKAGIAMYFIPEAELWHKVSSLTGQESDFTYYYGARGRAILLFKHKSRILAWIWTTSHLLYDAWRAAVDKSFRHACSVKFRGMMDGSKVAIEGR
jgi:GT2 family glycosyltransferase